MNVNLDELRGMDERILETILARKLRLSAKAIAAAKEAAWRDLPSNERRSYLRFAEEAVQREERVS